MRKRLWIVALLLALLPARHAARAATYTVTNTNDSGVGSLRQAIIDANINPGDDTIEFDIPADTDPGCDAGTGVCTIQPTSALPALTGGGTTIDGYTQPGALEATDTTSATLKIVIDGSNAGGANGFTIESSDNLIKGLVINHFSWWGVDIIGSSATSNVVSGNHIGTDANGTADLGNTWSGVSIGFSAQNNTVGGTTAGERNVISGNDRRGVSISGSDTMSNTVSGNHIGTDANGTADLGNAWAGVYIYDGAQNNTVGGDTEGERNVISGNNSGVSIYGNGTTGNTVSGNYIGTDVNGAADLGNTWDGVSIEDGAQNNTVGGDTAGERNVISGNDWYGVHIWGSSTMSNTISGNYIGTDASGTADLGNTNHGVCILGGAQNNTVGGTTAAKRNVISGNDWGGVSIYSSGTTGNAISGNYIGPDANGTADLGNTHNGVSIYSDAQNNIIGGDTAGERNVISGNGMHGLSIDGSGTTGNTVSGNYIGTDASGMADLGNAWHGVRIDWDAQNNTVGPDNFIANNGWDGVEVNGSSTTGNTIIQNSIFSNTMGIDLTDGANGGIAAPVIFTTTLGSVNIVGTACASCTVEVFENSDTDGEGETYVGDTTATASGAFTVTVSYLTKPYLTATATDAISGTSEFSAVFTATVPLAPPVGPLYFPIIMKNYP